MDKGRQKACFLWQYEGYKKWITYSAEETDIINNAFNRKQKSVTLPAVRRRGRRIIHFGDMFQDRKTESSSRKHQIRCCLLGEDCNFYVWQWKRNDSCWYSYTPNVALELERCYKQGREKFSYYFNEMDYELNFADMIETNETTAASRSVERSKITLAETEKALLKVALGSKHMRDKTDQSGGNSEDENCVSSKKKRKVRKTDSEENDVCTQTVVIKGPLKIPVDPKCTQKVGVAHIYFDGKNIFDVMLHKTSLQSNSNSYCHLQLLEDDISKDYSIWYHCGRIGQKGQSHLRQFQWHLDRAVYEFKKRFHEKTGNKWDQRDLFVKLEGKYDLLKVDYNVETSTDARSSGISPLGSQMKLDPKVVSLIELICDVKLLEQTVMEMQYDAKKAPLGKLTVEQIKLGYIALKKIEDVIISNGRGSELVRACNDFYTRIPHDFGRKPPPLIESISQIKEKMKMLEALTDMQIAVKVLNEKCVHGNMAYSYYQALQCEIKPLDHESTTFKTLEKYLQNTHGPTHSQYTLSVLDIFECHKEEEEKRFEDVGNRTLLWHGSRLTNFVGILKQGLRIAPPEAPSTGYMFGKGVYFTDMSSKSANYCYPTEDDGLLLLCEVALGKCNELMHSNYQASNLPNGKHSVMGLGITVPDAKGTIILDDGVKVPLGTSKVRSHSGWCDYVLQYNEYIVYNVNQIKMRYLVRIKFNFTNLF